MTILYTQVDNIRRDKLNSQFIVTKISILHAGGRSFFIFQTSRECWKRTSKSPRPRPLINAIGGWDSKCHNNMFTVHVLNMNFEKI